MSHHRFHRLVLSASFAVSATLFSGATAASAQAAPTATNPWKLHWARMDAGVGVTGQLTTDLTNQDIATNGTTLPHQSTTMSPGALVQFHAQPYDLVGLEFNYQYTRFSERFSHSPTPFGADTVGTNVPTSMHEFTTAYLVHLHHISRFNPYVGLGGGALDFQPGNNGTNNVAVHQQWRGVALADVGFDFQTVSNLGFRIGARDLAYRAPDFGTGQLSSSRWVSTEEPYAGVYLKF